MSRSFKKIACLGSEGRKHLRFAKRQSNKKIRRSVNIPNGKQYRKIYDTWDIRDFQWKEFRKLEVESYIERNILVRHRIYMK